MTNGSFAATTSMSSRSKRARMTRRPMRPKPLIPTRIFSPSPTGGVATAFTVGSWDALATVWTRETVLLDASGVFRGRAERTRSVVWSATKSRGNGARGRRDRVSPSRPTFRQNIRSHNPGRVWRRRIAPRRRARPLHLAEDRRFGRFEARSRRCRRGYLDGRAAKTRGDAISGGENAPRFFARRRDD